MKNKKFKVSRKPTNYGKGSQPDYERNENLINDYLSGTFTMAQLVGKYEISQQRIYEILDKYDIERKRTTTVKTQEGGEK